jgi:hypothetical protein
MPKAYSEYYLGTRESRGRRIAHHVSRVGESVRQGSSSAPFDGRDGLENALQERHRHHQGKYPSAKEIDILTMGRAPNNMLCSNNNDVDTIIQPYEDAA